LFFYRDEQNIASPQVDYGLGIAATKN